MNISPFTFISDSITSSLSWVEFKETTQWCKDNIYLSSEASPYTGMITFEKTPWIEEILNDWDKPWIEEFDIMASTQVGKTTIEFCCIAKELDTDPCMMQLTTPTEDGVSDYVTTKFDPFFKGVKSLQNKMNLRREEEKTRFKGALKEVPGGKLFILGNTPGNRRSKSVKYIFMDEVALFGSGHVAELRGRTKFFEKTGRKIFLVSSRKHKGDEIELAYKGSYCKKELQVLCKGCKNFFYPTSKHFKYLTRQEYKEINQLEKMDDRTKYKREAKHTGRVECECGHSINSRDIENLVREKNVKLVVVEGEDNESRHGYKLNALATALTNYSTIVEELIDAEFDDIATNTVYQDYFNEHYEKEIKTTEASDLLLLGNGLEKWKVPEDTIKIYMGVDTQKDHFWYEVKAYCYGNRSHSMAHGRLETFEDIEQIWEIGQNLVSEHGEVFQIQKLGIDRRGFNQDGIKRTDEVDMWVRKMIQKWKRGDENRIYGTEGEPKLTGDAPYKIAVRKDDSDNRVKIDIKVMKLSNIYLKTSIRTAMANTIDMAKSEFPEDYDEAPHFFVNQTTIDADAKGTVATSYTRQISVEVYDFGRDKHGKLNKEKSFINPKQADNHLFDTSVICEGFAQKDQVYMEKKPTNENIAEALSGLGDLS
jgi:phage terminase large subunit GpA-like protein